jgi:PKD repeat protein
MKTMQGAVHLLAIFIAFFTAGCGGGNSSSTPTVPIPVAGFSFTPASPLTGQSLEFTDTSTNSPTSWAWSFGDGGTSSTQNPTHTFVNAGAYTVTLAVTNAGGSNSTSQTITVTPSIQVPVAGFSYAPSVPWVGQSLAFTDASTNTATSWSWSFGDGGTSTVQNPTHVFTNAGTYTVTLAASNSAGSNSTSRSITVSAIVQAPTAAFGFSPSAPSVGQSVAFTDASTNGAASWSWAFGDGGTSSLQSPTHVYSTAGSYAVTLTVSNGIGSNSVTQTLVVAAATLTYPVVDTNQTTCYDDAGALASFPSSGDSYYGQDAQYSGHQKSYTLSADDKTVYDNVTGLTWQSSPNTTNTTPTYYDKKTYTEALAVPAVLNAMAYGGFSDWRLPTLKEMYSLIQFSGIDCSGLSNTYSDTASLTPFIDKNYFKFSYGDAVLDGRILESQYYTTTTFINNPGDRGVQKQFGVNFADGRIKGYDISSGGAYFRFFVLCVRGNASYGINNFTDNADDTVTDSATGLMWAKNDSGSSMNWATALAWVQTKNSENYLGYNDWRLPNAKELQSIVDYGNAPEYNSKPAINTDFFNVTSLINEEGEVDYPYFWASTTHACYFQAVSTVIGKYATYVAFGRSLGYSSPTLIDVHGAGVQKSDPKTTTYLSSYNTATVNGVAFYYWGPQNDILRAMNYIRLVRTAN